MTEEEQRLLASYIKTQEITYLSELYHPYMALVYGVALKYFKDSTVAQDAVMDIFEKLHRRNINPEIQNFKAFLYTVTKNHCYEELRKKKTRFEKEKDAEIMYSGEIFHPDNIDREPEMKNLDDCLKKLDEDQKNCIDLFYYQKMSYQEISEQLSIAFNQVRSRIQNGRRNLKLCIESISPNS